MLTKKEAKLIKTYGVLLKLAIPGLIMSFVPGGIWLVLVMIDDIALDSKGGLYVPGFAAFLAFVIINLTLFCYSALRVKFGTSSKTWQKMIARGQRIYQETDIASRKASMAAGTMAAGRLMKKSSNKGISGAGRAAEIAGAVETVDAASEQVGIMLGNVYEAADYFHVKIPSAKKYVILIILLPFIVMPGLFIPEFLGSKAEKAAEIERVQETEMQLESAFAQYFSQVDKDDPSDRISSSYMVTGCLLDENDVYMSTEVDSDGIVTELIYHMNVIPDLSADENLEKLNGYIGEMSSVVDMAGVSTGEYRLTSVDQVPQDMGAEYLAGSQDQDAYITRDIDNMRVTFSHKMENGTESSPSYFYVTVKRQK